MKVKKEDKKEIPTRKDLLRYYRFVNTCKLCGRYYGIDNQNCETRKDTCPVCVGQSNENHGGIRRRYSDGA